MFWRACFSLLKKHLFCHSQIGYSSIELNGTLHYPNAYHSVFNHIWWTIIYRLRHCLRQMVTSLDDSLSGCSATLVCESVKREVWASMWGGHEKCFSPIGDSRPRDLMNMLASHCAIDSEGAMLPSHQALLGYGLSVWLSNIQEVQTSTGGPKQW